MGLSSPGGDAMKLRILSFLLTLFTGSSLFAQYFTFQEEIDRPNWQDPVQISQQIVQATSNLLKWRFVSEPRPVAPIKYNRAQQFGSWIRDPRTGNCLNTRARVLNRDSKTPVEFAESNPCRVESGTWNDPYTGQKFSLSSDVDIDHVVALKNAYDSGAFAWAKPYRCIYTNFLGYKNQLLAVSGRENQIKSDKGPDRWMPPNPQFACQHLQNWLAVKFIWKLNMSESEVKAIQHYVSQHRCPTRLFQANQMAVLKMRDQIHKDVVICQKN